MRPFKAFLLAGTALGGGGTPSVPGISNKWRIRFFYMQSGGKTDPQIGGVVMRDTPGGPNLCVGGTPLSSSDYNASFPASLAFDGDPNTRWVGGSEANGHSTPQWIGYEFPSPVAIAEVAMTAFDFTGSMPTVVSTEYWDGFQWVIYNLRDIGAEQGVWNAARQTKTWAVTPFPAPDDLPHRYWRVGVLANSNLNIWVGATEIEFAESVGGADAGTTTGQTISSGAPNTDGSPAAAFDKNSNNWQYSNGGGGGNSPWHWGRWVGQDFGAGNPKNIREVRILPNTLSSPGATVGPSLLQYSDDNVTWKTKFQIEPVPWAAGVWQSFNATGIAFLTGPTITGTMQVGDTLTASYTTNAVGAAEAFVWKRNGAVIPGETGPTKLRVAEDEGTQLVVEVTLTKNGKTITKASPPRTIYSTSSGVTSSRWRVRTLSSQYLAVSDIEMRLAPGGADLTSGGVAVASSVLNGNFIAGAAFDNNSATNFHSASGSDHWLEYQFAAPTGVNELAVRCRTDDTTMWQPGTLRLEYWDGAAWQLKIEFAVTGWSQGTQFIYDVRSDDQRTLGPELLLDPALDDASKYPGTGGGWTVSGGQLVASGGVNEFVISATSLSTPLVAGKRYQLSFPYSGRSGGNLRIRNGTSGTVYRVFTGTELGSSGTFSYAFTAVGGTINFQADAAAINITAPSMSLRELV